MSHEKMSADELAAICERDAAVGALIARGALIPGPVVMAALDDRGRLLRHIAALEAERRACPVAPCDREALGWAAYLMIEWRATECTSASVRQAWDRLKGTERRELYCHAGEALHAAGAASRQAEVDALEAKIRAFQQAAGDPDAETVTPEMVEGRIAKLTAERDAMKDRIDALNTLGASKNRRLNDVDERLAAAHVYGAREEREAIVPLLIQPTDAIRARGQAK